MTGTTRPEVFSSVRAAQLAAQRTETLAIEMPQTSRLSTSAARTLKDWDGKLGREEWQAEGYGHANDIGELGFGVNLIAATCAKGDLAVAEEDEMGTPVEPGKAEDGTPIFTSDREAAERVLAAFKGPGGGRQALIGAGSIHDQIGGEAVLIGEPIEDTKGISWELVSVLEVFQDKDTGTVTRKRSAKSGTALSVADPSATSNELGEDVYLARYLRSDWAHSGDATSPLRRNAAACREINLWTKLIETTIKSRLSNGLFLIPEEADFPADDDDRSEQTSAERFEDMIVDQISTPITDPSSVASVSPAVAAVQGDLIDKFKLMSLTPDSGIELTGMLEARANALRRLAAGMDMPLEVMEGTGSTSHWNAAGIDVDFVKQHVIPLGERLARFFTVSYFRRMLIEFEGMDEAKAERFSLTYDGSELLTRADAAATADTLHRDMLISDDARVIANGMDPDAVRPTEEEKQRRILEKLVVTPSVNNRPLIPALGIDLTEYLPPDVVEAFLAPSQQNQGGEGAAVQPPEEPSGGGNEPPVDSGDGAGPTEPAAEPDGSAELAVMERIRAVSASALDTALVLAGNRVATNARKLTDETKAKVDRPDYRPRSKKPELLRLMSAADWKRIKLSPERLLEGAWDQVDRQAVMWLKGLYVARGLDSLSADEQARRAASEICHSLDGRALTAFEQPIALEDGLSVPLDLVRAAVVGTPAR